MEPRWDVVDTSVGFGWDVVETSMGYGWDVEIFHVPMVLHSVHT